MIRSSRALRRIALAVGLLVGGASPIVADAQGPPPTAVQAPAAERAAAPAAEPVTTPGAADVSGVGLVVPAGATAAGFTLLRGRVDVFGRVAGDVITVGGDVVVHPGAEVSGHALSMLGSVRVLPGARVGGESRSLARSARLGTAEATRESPPSGAAATWRSVKVVVGWFAILLVIGVGVLASGSVYLDGVSEALEGSPARALAVGLAGQVLLLPALITVSVLLAVTLVGVLAIPLAVVAFVLAAAGLVTLGFLAAAFVTGRSLGGMRGPWRATAERAGAVRALVLGLSALLALWLGAALLTTLPSAALVVRAVALAVTWVAGTAGFGAALLSRAGTRGLRPTPAARAAVGTMPVDRGGVPVWQTPTPLTGIVAARRPTPVPPRVE